MNELFQESYDHLEAPDKHSDYRYEILVQHLSITDLLRRIALHNS